MVTAHFSFSQIMTRRRKRRGRHQRKGTFEMQIFVVGSKASLGNVWPGFLCTALV